ncbi:hypothetical protein [Halobellus rufus]|uniref:hypothetical protein n=1 Tax=Halobellus rufus TaxID=1448860 RepID=UPI000678EA97|nr:hypothetical protein [Halobellus rufus]
MICPYCGSVDESVPTPEKGPYQGMKELGDCTACGRTVVSAGVQRGWESSKLSTVQKGQANEADYADVYVERERGASHEDRGQTADIDRTVFDGDGNLLYYWEFKQRSCSINGYKYTKFPYRKIEEARDLVRDAPVRITLKFLDCWAELELASVEDCDVEQGGDFKPMSRGESANQQSAKIDVETLRVLPWRDGCDDLSV